MAEHAFPLTIQQMRRFGKLSSPVAEQHSLKIQAPQRKGGEVLKTPYSNHFKTTPKDKEDAIKDVSSGKYTLSESVILHGVPRKTLTK